MFSIAFLTAGSVAVWAYVLAVIADHAMAHPSSVAYGTLFAYVVLGGICVSVVPGFLINAIPEDEELPGALE